LSSLFCSWGDKGSDIELSDLQKHVYGRRDGTDNTLYYVDATVTFQPGAAELFIENKY